MKRSFIPAGIFVLVLLVAAVSMKYYMKYEYRTTMEKFFQAETVYTIFDYQTEKTYSLTDPESQVALSGFLQDTLVLDKSVNGDPKTSPNGTNAYSAEPVGGPTLVVSREDPTLCYIKGRIFTHYFTGGEAAATYLSSLIENRTAA